MKRLLLVASVLAFSLTLSAPALAGHNDHLRGQRLNRRPGRIVVHETYHRVRPRIGFHLSIGYPGVHYAPAPFYHVPPPLYYYRALPVFEAPGPCGVYLGAHYVRDARRGVRVYHDGLRHGRRGYRR